MKRIINMLAGGENATPLKKGVVYAALGTLIALILAIAVLVGSSIALNLSENAGGVEPDAGEVDGGNNGGASAKPVEFTTLESIAALKEKVDDSTVSLQSARTEMPESQQIGDIKRYYDAWNDSVPAKTQKAIDSLLVKYYEQKQDNNILVFSTDSVTVTVSVSDSDDYSECTPITVTTHKWIFDHAYEYGFIYTENKFQYVGKELATYLRTSNDLTPIKAKTADKAQPLSGGYYAYYVAADATEIKVPKSLNYNVIADGADGYIVVYKK